MVSAIAQYRPSFPQEIQGLAPAELEELRSLAGRELPPSYREFLHLMGRSMGELVLFEHADFSAQAARKVFSRKNIPRPPERYFRIGINQADPYDVYYLDLGTQGDSPVVSFPSVEDEKDFPAAIRQQIWQAASLYELVFIRAYYQFYLDQFSNDRMLDCPKLSSDFRERVTQVLTRLRFVLHPQSSSTTVCYERGDTTVVISETPGQTPLIHVLAHSRNELLKLSEILIDNLHLNPV